MATGLYFISLCLFVIVSADVTLVPSGNVSVCASGGEISLTCVVTEGSLVWITPTGNHIFDSLQAPTSEGRFYLVVDNADTNITSTASLSNFQPEDDGLFIRCREFSTAEEAEAVLRFTGAPNVTLSKLSSTSVNISWNPSDCAVQYVITINSTDDTAYNITTTDTYTTVSLDSLPKFCVIVYRVDISNRTGPPSQQQCYYSPIIPSNSNIATTPSPTDDQPSGVSGGVIAGVVIAAVIVIILAVIIAVAVLVVIVKKKGFHGSTNDEIPLVQYGAKEHRCVCHILYQKLHLKFNGWKVVFVFVPAGENIESFYQDYQVYGTHFDCHWKSSGTIGVNVSNSTNGWTVHTSDCKVDKAIIDGYTGGDSPPHMEMMITADSDKITPPDLTVEAKLKGVNETSSIKFKQFAHNVVECVCQVFYHKIALNHWRARVAFFPKEYLEIVNKLYQDANNCKPLDIKFGGGVIKVSTDDTVIPAGWEVTINKKHQQVTTAAVEQYTGEGDPPYCEMTLRATDSDESDELLQLPVTLIGVREQSHNTFYVERALEKSDGVLLYKFSPSFGNVNISFVCQVFYHKLEEINHWKATLAFFTENKTNRVKQLYQDANLGQTIKDVKFSKFDRGTTYVIKPDITEVGDGWNMTHKEFKLIKKTTIVEYNGVDKPPCCVMIFKAVPGVSTPPDLSATIIIGEPDKPTKTFFISRVAAETQSEQQQLDLAKSPDFSATSLVKDSDCTMKDLQCEKSGVETAEETMDDARYSRS